uniref:SCP domain-containing protein n=1 Tax=Mesocestoides corti TaxID=53468 RepID=A0A5K3FM85_MESCO
MRKFIFLLLLPALHVLAKVPSDEEHTTIIECHTKLREHVKPTASNMQLMNYSIELEKLAQEYASACEPTYPESNGRYADVGFSVMLSQERRFKYDDLCYINNSYYDFDKDACDHYCDNYKQS